MAPASVPRRTGVLIIRAWIDEHSGGLRAHVTSQLDIERSAKEQVGADERGTLVKIVEHWVDRFTTDEPGCADGPAPGRDAGATER